MEKVLRLYKYIDGINDIAFPNEKEQAIITSFRYDAKRMGAAPTISFSLMHSSCLDSLWDNKVYALFNGERFYVKQTPTSSYSSSDTRYKHEVELVSERFILDNIYFYDVVSSSSQDKPVSNSSKFSFFGNIKEYVSRLNNSLNKSNVGYSIVIDDDILSDEALMSIESQVTFEDQVITNALQEIYNVYKIPYYFVGKNIHVGYYQDNIDTVFKYGCKNSLISISKTNANSKIINKITGVGSSDNIPYYYPNVDEKGITQVLCNGREGKAVIIDLAKYRKVKLADKFVFHETIQSIVSLIDEDDYSFGDFRDEGIDDDGKQRVSIDFYYSFTLQQYESVEFSVTTTYEDSLDLRYEIFNPSGQYVGYYKEDKTMQLTGGNYQFVIRWSFLSKEPMIGSDDVIKNFVSQYIKVKANIVVDSSNAWTKNNIPVTLSDYGISVNSPSDGDVLTIERLAYIQPQPNLVPPIYRNTEGGERFYEAINGKYKNEQGDYYQFDNEYTTTNPREHIENFDDIKPTIKNVVNDSGDYIDEFIDFAYDLDDNDETDESGKFIHPYFFGKLRRFDGEFGFNLFDHAIDEGEMVVSMTSGTCGSCEFVIGVDEQSQKNIVQVDADGNLVRDNNGNVRRTGTPQDRQNDTKNNEVWIALKKDIQTFGVVMPNVGNNYRPKAKDKFVLLHIDLPQQYVEAAENALKDKLIKYMHENNFEKFNFSIAFSRIYFAENPTILAKLSENSKIQVEYNKNIYNLYISSLSYSIANDSALPEVKVELEDALSISQNQITQVVESTKREIISSIDKNVFWGDIKGVPTWITSDKPRYSYSELSGRGTSDNSNDVWVVKKDAQGNSYVYTKLDVVVERGVTMYGTDGSVDVPSIFEGLPIDNDTIYWEETKDEEGNVIARVLKSRGVGEGGVTPTMLGDLINVGKWANAIATEDRIMVQKKDSSSWEALELSKIGGSASFENVKESGKGNAFTSFVLSEDKKTLTFVKDKTFSEKSSTLSGYGITDAYTKTEADNLLAKKWTQDDNKITNWDTAFGWGDHSKANYATKSSTLSGYGITNAYTKTQVDNLIGDFVTSDDVETLLDDYLPLTGGTITGDLRLRKGSEYTSPYLYFGDSDEVWLKEATDTHLTIHADGGVNIDSPATFIDGIKIEKSADGVLYIDADLVVKGGVTMFANEGSYTPSTIMDAVSVDNQTIIKQGGKLMVNPELVFGGGGGEVSTVTWDNVLGKPTWITDTKPVYRYTEISGIPDLSVYATKGTSLSHYGITDAYTKTNVDSLLSAKWTKDGTKISNWDTAYSWGNHAQAGYLKSADFTKDKIKTTLGISDWALASTKPSYTTKEVAEDTNLYFTNARAVSALTETLKGYVTLSGTQTISGEKNFTGGLKVNGSPIVYNATGKYWKFEGDLLVTGGITMFGSDSSFSPSTITQAVNIDGSTLVRKNGVIMLNPDIQIGGDSDIDLSEYAKKATTLAGYDISDAYTKTEVDNNFVAKTTKDFMKVNGSLTSNVNFNDYYTPGSYNNTTGNGSGNSNAPSTYGLMLVFGDKSGFAAQLHVNSGNTSVKVRTRYMSGGSFSWKTWKELAYTTSNVASSTKLETPRKIWGQDFDGTEDVSGALSGVTSISMNGSINNAITVISEEDGSTIKGAGHRMYFGGTGYANQSYYFRPLYGSSGATTTALYLQNASASSSPTFTTTHALRSDGSASHTGNLSVGGSVTINGGILTYNSTNKYWKLEGDLLVTGGVTMFGNDSSFSPSTITQAVNVDGTTIINDGKKLMLNPDIQLGGGGVTDYNDLTNKPDLSVYALKTSLSSYQTKITSTNKLDYGLISGTPTIPTNTNQLTNGAGFITSSGSITGNAATATTASKLSTVSKSAWGKTYWTSGGVPTDINGDMSSVGNITSLANGTYDIGSSTNKWKNLWVGNVKYTDNIYLGFSSSYASIRAGGSGSQLIVDSKSVRTNSTASARASLGKGDVPWSGLYLGIDSSAGNNKYGVNFSDANGNTVARLASSGALFGIYAKGELRLRGGCTAGIDAMTASSTGVVIDASGNILVTGGITMYSDLRKKTILNHVELSLKEVADAPLIEHYYNSDEKKTTHVGSVAQYWARLNDWFCKEDGEGFLTMEIQNAALASAISVARELTRYESKTDKQIKKLKKRIGELEEEIENLKKV